LIILSKALGYCRIQVVTELGALMKIPIRGLLKCAAVVLFSLAMTQTVRPQSRSVVHDGFQTVNDVRLHYLVAGKGEPVILLHGYAQNSRMWRPLIAELAKTRLVIAPDLRGFGQSSKPESGYYKKTMAQDIHALAVSLGFKRASVVGHDIGLMVAYAYAAQYPAEVDRIVLLDAFLPGVGDWKTVWLLRDLWHFHFYGVTPLKLVAGRERIYFEHFWNDLLPTQSIQFRKPIADSMREPTLNRERCGQALKFFALLSKMRKTSSCWRKPNLQCRCWY
jgi:pimeloyl-ACP methyl ester carboxylesterase